MKKLMIVLVVLSLSLTSACDVLEDIVDKGSSEESTGYIKSSLSRETSPPRH